LLHTVMELAAGEHAVRRYQMWPGSSGDCGSGGRGFTP
jgi:hypothetical protein